MATEMTRTPVENHAEWRAKVEDYIDEGDRGVEPIYVGREDLLHTTSRMVRSATKSSRTFVVSGGPGAGKTAFLNKVAEEWKDRAVRATCADRR